MTWLLLLLASISWAGYEPLPADSQDATDANFKRIYQTVLDNDLTDGGTVQYMLTVSSDLLVLGTISGAGSYTQAASSTILYSGQYSGNGLGVPLDVQRASVTTTGKDVLIRLDGILYQAGASAGGAISVDVRMDEAAISNFPLIYNQGGSGDFPYYVPFSRFFRLPNPGAGSHGFYVSMAATGGASRLYCGNYCVLTVTEAR